MSDKKNNTARIGDFYLNFDAKSNEIYIERGTANFRWSNMSYSEKRDLQEAWANLVNDENLTDFIKETSEK